MHLLVVVVFFFFYTHGSSLNLFSVSEDTSQTQSSSLNSGQLLGIIAHERLV